MLECQRFSGRVVKFRKTECEIGVHDMSPLLGKPEEQAAQPIADHCQYRKRQKVQEPEEGDNGA